MRKEFDRASEALLRSPWVTVQVGILSIVAAAGVVLDRLDLAICLCLDVLIEDVVLW